MLSSIYSTSKWTWKGHSHEIILNFLCLYSFVIMKVKLGLHSSCVQLIEMQSTISTILYFWKMYIKATLSLDYYIKFLSVLFRDQTMTIGLNSSCVQLSSYKMKSSIYSTSQKPLKGHYHEIIFIFWCLSVLFCDQAVTLGLHSSCLLSF